MKRYFISSILFLGAALMFCGCPKNLGGKPEPEPIFYYQFTKINETTDFFDNNTTYTPDSLFYQEPSWTKKSLFRYYLVNTKRVFGPVSANFSIYHKNSDIDTVSSMGSGGDGRIRSMNNLKVSFNGKVVKEFDFKNNPSLAQELYTKNCETCGAAGAIVISLPKWCIKYFKPKTATKKAVLGISSIK